MHWLGRALLSLLELPVAPAPVEPLLLEPVLPLPLVLGLLVELPLLPVALGLVVELPLLPEVCAQDTLARPSRAAATAALSVFTITLCTPSKLSGENCSP
jgi:hypothetical protein